MALLQATNRIPRVVHSDDKRALKSRAKELTQGDWAAKAVKDAINETYAAIAAASDGGAAGSS